MSKIFESIHVPNRIKDLVDKCFKSLDSESTEKGTTVGSSIGDDTLIGSVCERSEAEDGEAPKTVDGDPIGLNIETESICTVCGDVFKQEKPWYNVCEFCASQSYDY